MAEFNRFDICEAYMVVEHYYHRDGWLQQRPSNQRRGESVSIQLERLGFKPGMGQGSYGALTDNGKEIFLGVVERLKLPAWTEADEAAELV